MTHAFVTAMHHATAVPDIAHRDEVGRSPCGGPASTAERMTISTRPVQLPQQ
jgi:hypothetical protein